MELSRMCELSRGHINQAPFYLVNFYLKIKLNIIYSESGRGPSTVEQLQQQQLSELPAQLFCQ